jgi:hypothetical protein
MMNEHRTIIELSDAEQDLVAGGCTPCEPVPVLLQGNDHLNFHANSPNTPAAENGFRGNGAQIVGICPI